MNTQRKPKTRILTFMRQFPAYHPRKGEPTFFVEKLCNSFLMQGYSIYLSDTPIEFLESLSDKMFKPKHHTIRAGNHFQPGDFVRPCVWAKPGGRFTKGNTLIRFATDIEVVKTWDFDIKIDEAELKHSLILLNKAIQDKQLVTEIAKNDGLEFIDFLSWFQFPKPFSGQIICWNPDIKY